MENGLGKLCSGVADEDIFFRFLFIVWKIPSAVPFDNYIRFVHGFWYWTQILFFVTYYNFLHITQWNIFTNLSMFAVPFTTLFSIVIRFCFQYTQNRHSRGINTHWTNNDYSVLFFLSFLSKKFVQIWYLYVRLALHPRRIPNDL